MADGLVCIGELAKKKSKQYAIDLASKPDYLDSCIPLPIPSIPYALIECDEKWLHEMREKGRDDEHKLVSSYAQWETARSRAILENENRLRGLLWCYRRLTAESLTELAEKVREFLSHHWGIDDPPLDRIEASDIAMSIVSTRVPR